MMYSQDPYAPPQEPAQPAVPAELGQPVTPMEPAQPVEPVRPVEPVAPVRPVEPVRRVVPVRQRVWTSAHTRPAYWVYFVLGVLEVLIGLRVLLRLFGANPFAGFTTLIYDITYPFVALFQGVFPTPHGYGSALEISSLLAMAIYALLAWGIVRLIESPRPRRPTATT
jgi:uncharacterized protein YggT (Ycf19 family)